MANQFLLEIDASLRGGAEAAAGLTSIGDRMTAAGASSTSFEAAQARLAGSLTASKAAAEAAAAGVSEAAAAYAKNEASADRLAKAAERVGTQVDAQRAKLQAAQDSGDFLGAEKAAGKLQNLVAKQAAAQSAATQAAAAIKAEGAALDALKAQANGAEQEHEQLAAAMKGVEKGAASAAKLEETNKQLEAGKFNAGEAAGAFGALPGPLGAIGGRGLQVVDSFKKLQASLGTTKGLIALLGVGLVAIAAAFAAAAISATIYGIKMADGARNAALEIEALEASGKNLDGIGKSFESITDATGLAAPELGKLAKQLDGAKVSAADMPTALKAIATAEAALGQGGSAEFVEQLKSGKKSAGELAKEIDSKLGPIAKKKMLSLDSQGATLKRTFGELFSGLDIEGLLVGFSKIIKSFDKTSALGKTIKWIFESLFQPLVDAAASAIPKVEAFILGLAIGGLKLYIAFGPAIKQLKELVGVQGDFDWLMAGEIAGTFVATALGLIVVAFLAIGASISATITMFQNFYAGAVGAVNAVKSAFNSLSEVDLGEIASDLIDGLVEGIKAGAAAVAAAMAGVATGALDSAKSALGIASPSKEAMKLMGRVTEGIEVQAKRDQPKADAAFQGAFSLPSQGDIEGGGGATGSTGGSAISLSNVTFNLFGVKDGDDAKSKIEDVMLRLIEGDVDSLRGPDPDGAPA